MNDQGFRILELYILCYQTIRRGQKRKLGLLKISENKTIEMSKFTF